MKVIISNILKQQDDYINEKEKEYLKKNSQFFTTQKIANKMVDELNIKNWEKDTISILEPAAGFGILIAILIKEIIKNKKIKNINLVAFELDKNIYSELSKSLLEISVYIYDNYNITLNYYIKNMNFIIANKDCWDTEENDTNKCQKFNLIISNPPYKKINKSNEEAEIMSSIVYGQPNIYQLFIAMSLNLLEDDGMYVAITPRNYLSGKYSKLLRKYIFNNYHLSSIHSFDDMNMFKEVDQEVIISKFIKEGIKDNITISNNGRFKFVTKFKNIVVSDDYALIVPKTNDDVEIYSKFQKLKNTLDDLNIKVSVGPVVQFRNTDFLKKKEYGDKFAPLLISGDIKANNTISYDDRTPSNRATDNKSINIKSSNIISNSNYILLRKVVSKKDTSLIYPAILYENHFNHDFLGIDNNILYFSKVNGEFSKEQLNGFYCYINSTSFERYYSIINGTYTINVNDFNFIHFPSIDIIEEMGKKLINSNDYSKINCEAIFTSNVSLV